jgi:hypothetical protein
LTPGPPDSRRDEMPALADEDAAVVQHHAGEEEGKVPEEVLDLAVPAGVRTVDHLHHVFVLVETSLNRFSFRQEFSGKISYACLSLS